MSEPTPAEAEATSDEVSIDFEGVTLTIQRDINEWPLDAVEAFENGKAIALVRAMWGSGTYDQMRAAFQVRTGEPMKLKDLLVLMDKIAQAAGFDNQGE